MRADLTAYLCQLSREQRRDVRDAIWRELDLGDNAEVVRERSSAHGLDDDASAASSNLAQYDLFGAIFAMIIVFSILVGVAMFIARTFLVFFRCVVVPLVIISVCFLLAACKEQERARCAEQDEVAKVLFYEAIHSFASSLLVGPTSASMSRRASR